jgi:hypothetical protein
MNPSMLRILAVCTLVLAACSGGEEFPERGADEVSPSAGLIAQTCNNSNIRGQPAQGTFCGGSTNAFNCSPGILYKCTSATGNNCTIASLCANGCVTGSKGGDACFAGTPALVIPGVSSTGDLSVAGGTELSATVNLSASHPAGSIVNVKDTNVGLVAARAFCNVPDLAAGQTTATFGIPTAKVTVADSATLYADIAYNDSVGQHELVSRAATITLTPGGTLPPPPKVTQLTMTPNSIAAGGVSFAYYTLDKMAPAANQVVDITSSDTTTAGYFSGGQSQLVAGGCTSGGGFETILAANQVPATKTVTISAVTEGSGQVPVNAPLTVTGGCSPKTCIDLPMPLCAGPDGCGGTLECGCSFTGVCGGGGPGVCGDPTTPTPPTNPAPPTNPTPASPTVSSITIAPATTTAGTSVTGTLTLSGPAGSTGATVGLTSSGSAATVPASVTIPAGFSEASFTISTNAVTASTVVTISATLGVSQSTTFTVTPKPVAAGAALTVNASGRSGVTINSSPAGIAVASGSSKTATFPVGTSITLTPTDGRTAVWSGACSSSKDTKSCTFTITGAATVNAAVK